MHVKAKKRKVLMNAVAPELSKIVLCLLYLYSLIFLPFFFFMVGCITDPVANLTVMLLFDILYSTSQGMQVQGLSTINQNIGQ